MYFNFLTITLYVKILPHLCLSHLSSHLIKLGVLNVTTENGCHCDTSFSWPSNPFPAVTCKTESRHACLTWQFTTLDSSQWEVLIRKQVHNPREKVFNDVLFYFIQSNLIESNPYHPSFCLYPPLFLALTFSGNKIT